jgi:histidine triad (HIT) family protein
MEDCLFCKIAAGEIPSTKVYEDDMMLAFRDIDPQAPEHIVIVPKTHIKSANELNEDNIKYVSHIWMQIPKIAGQLGFAENGYRVVNNCGKDGGQTVGHLHFHLMGGREFGWPAG